MIYSFFDAETGEFRAGFWCGPADLLDVNTPDGHAAIEGRYDHLSQRVDLTTGQVVDWQPPAPANTELATHRWDAETRRWVAEPTPKALRLTERARITALIVQAEEATARPLRELLLDPMNAAARERLTAVNAQIAALRAAMPPIDLPEEPAP